VAANSVKGNRALAPEMWRKPGAKRTANWKLFLAGFIWVLAIDFGRRLA
jgi:hypothetical protein